LSKDDSLLFTFAFLLFTLNFMIRSEMLQRVRHAIKFGILLSSAAARPASAALWTRLHAAFDVLLLEQNDFGKGTSSRSTKLVHGGVRYLAQGNLALVKEALKERGLLKKNAPHLVKIHLLSCRVTALGRNFSTARA
jgi:glycerol-3-phosphate dehydrogenase